jgi:hypothetical protein
MSVAAIVIYRQRIKRILEELEELEKELCTEHKSQLRKITQRIRDELI